MFVKKVKCSGGEVLLEVFPVFKTQLILGKPTAIAAAIEFFAYIHRGSPLLSPPQSLCLPEVVVACWRLKTEDRGPLVQGAGAPPWLFSCEAWSWHWRPHLGVRFHLGVRCWVLRETWDPSSPGPAV